MVTRQPVAAGEELLISYGAHDDALLLSQVLIINTALASCLKVGCTKNNSVFFCHFYTPSPPTYNQGRLHVTTFTPSARTCTVMLTAPCLPHTRWPPWHSPTWPCQDRADWLFLSRAAARPSPRTPASCWACLASSPTPPT